ncbi:MAG: hypothetical protein IJL54_03225 [Prevotella sp.]|nr:hypothetical protein [Prevotella sp.]
MKKRSVFYLLPVLAMSMTVALVVSSCSDDDDLYNSEPAASARSFDYGLWMYGENAYRQLVLDNLSTEIKTVNVNSPWLKASVGEMVGGHPTLILESQNAKGRDLPNAVLTVTTENGEEAHITVKHSEMTLGDAYSSNNNGLLCNDQNNFLTEWWKCNTVKINGLDMPQATPWIVEGGLYIPPTVRDSYRPDQGWEMAFSYLNDYTLDGTRYFALYNKYTGVLRVFTYLLNPKGEGNELSFMVKMGEANSLNMFPLYHQYEFGIPTCHDFGSSLSRNPLIYDGQDQPFMTLVTPYRQTSSLATGWHCFDIDMSAYSPSGKDWLRLDKKEAKLTIFPNTETTQAVSLFGSIAGDIGGTFSNEKIIQHGGGNCMSGICGVLDMLSGKASNSISSANTYASLMTKNGGNEGWGAYLNPAKYWGGFGLSIASGALGMIGSYMAEPVSYDTIPGKIDLKADLQLDASGYIKTFNATDIRGLAVAPEAISSVNGSDGHMGKGIWGLAEDPVVYIDTEDLMSTYDHVNLAATANGYSNTSFGDYEMRIVYAFDPTSIKVNINRDLYPELSDVNVTTTVGVYPARPCGYTEPYRQFMMMGTRPTFSLAPGKTSGVVRLNNSSTPRLWQVTPADLCESDKNAYDTPDKSVLMTQPGGNFRFYSPVHTEFFKTIMVNPQVYVPYVKGGAIGLPQAPDFVVCVTVSFYTHKNHPADAEPCTFSKVFIPKAVLVDRNGMKTVANNLRSYADNCKNDKAINTLANDHSVPVYQGGGHQLIAKTLRMFNKLGL